jgi:transglutaminase-like putative cysteine protease
MALDWTGSPELRWQASKDIDPMLAKQPKALALTLTDPAKIVAPQSAPARYGIGRLVEYSSFKTWQAVSASESALFSDASRLPAEPSLEAEVDRIAKSSAAPRERALAALVLVQDSIRYVFTGMDGGSFRPATVGQTWERRFGDCKGKTAMLLGILRKLGVPAEAVLVDMGGGDGLDERLPNPGMFDHVLVRATIGGQRYWLDGTRSGEGRLLGDTDVPYRWVLPLSARGEALEALPFTPPARPSEITYLDIDASAGPDAKAQVTMTRVLRGDAALFLKLALQSVPKETAEAKLREQTAGWIDPQSAEWRYDQPTGTIMFKVKGPATLDWDKDGTGDATTYTYYLPGGGFYRPERLERATGQDVTVPYANTPDRFVCSATRVTLPATKGQNWTISAKPMDRVIGGIAYYRTANLDHGVVNLVRSTRTIQMELSPIQAIAANRLIPGFDDKQSRVESEIGAGDSTDIADKALPSLASIDWIRDAALCRSTARD